MDKSYFIGILHKYLQGNASKEERQFLLRYYNLFDSEPDVMALLKEEQKEALKNEMQTAIWESINLHSQKKKKRTSLITKIAASLLILVICATGVTYFLYQTTEHNLTTAKPKQWKEHRLFRLPDGSTVIASAGSKFHYPSSFDGLAKREVYLEGKAYFDIKHNPEKPFIVHTGQLKTTVLGTAFYIEAWPVDENISITVTRGKVEVANQDKIFGIIRPDEQLIYSKAKGDVVQQNVDMGVYQAWKEQDMVLDNVTVGEAAELLEERFKVNITCNDKLLREKRFTTTFLKGESLELVLKSICEFNDAVYEYDKEKESVIISSK